MRFLKTSRCLLYTSFASTPVQAVGKMNGVYFRSQVGNLELGRNVSFHRFLLLTASATLPGTLWRFILLVIPPFSVMSITLSCVILYVSTLDMPLCLLVLFVQHLVPRRRGRAHLRHDHVGNQQVERTMVLSRGVLLETCACRWLRRLDKSVWADANPNKTSVRSSALIGRSNVHPGT